MARRLIVFDTSVYVPYYRGEAYRDYVRRETSRGRVRLCSVVLQELYAGTRSPQDTRDLKVIERAFSRMGYLLTPTHQDWITAGQAISHSIRTYGALNPRDHLNDILIILCAAQVGARIVTENSEHFERWTRQISRMGFKAKIESIQREDHFN